MKAIKELDGVAFKNRKLVVKLHEPYVPLSRFSRFTSTGSTRRRRAPDALGGETVEDADDESARVAAPKREITYSENSVFIRGLSHLVSEQELTRFLMSCKPTLVKILKPKGIMKGLKHRAYSALVTFDVSEDTTVDIVIESFNGKEFEGSTIKVMKAYRLEEKREKTPAAASIPEEPETNAETDGGADGAAGGTAGEAPAPPAAEGE